MSDRSVIIRKFENQIASYSDYLSETSDKIMYREYITPKKGKEIIVPVENEFFQKFEKNNNLIIVDWEIDEN